MGSKGLEIANQRISPITVVSVLTIKILAAVVEPWRDNAPRRGKTPGHRRMVFVRGNLAQRVVRRSRTFSAPTFGRKRRAPTNEECRRSYPVHPDAWPGSREFPEREKGVEGLASTHLGSLVYLSKRRALLFPRLDANTNHYIFAGRANFASSSENAFTRGVFIFAPKGESTFHSKTCLRTILSYYPGEYSLPIS
jgi:hypothetical protein